MISSNTEILLTLLVTVLCPALCDAMDCNPPGSSVHGLLQARILEWVAISFSILTLRTLQILYPAQTSPPNPMTFCNPMDCSTPGSPVLHYLSEFAQTHVHWVDDVIQPSHPQSSLSPPALSLSQHQGKTDHLSQWDGSLHQVAKVLEFQHESFQWLFRVDYL